MNHNHCDDDLSRISGVTLVNPGESQHGHLGDRVASCEDGLVFPWGFPSLGALLACAAGGS